MASRPKRTLHKVRRFVEEFVFSDVKESVKKRPKKDNNLYKVEIKELDRQNKRIRIHFKGSQLCRAITDNNDHNVHNIQNIHNI